MSVLFYSVACFFLLAVDYFFNGGQVQELVKGRLPNTSLTNKGKYKLHALKFTPLPLGSVRPTANSWLDLELQHSATGLAGHLWDFYAFVKDSTWLGGSESRGEYSGLHEGFPYWFNGLVALAYSHRDDGNDKVAASSARLKAQVHDAADTVLNLQAEDGWLGTETLASGDRTLWGRFPLLLGLTSLVEANATGWEPRIMTALWKFVGLAHTMLKNKGTGFVSQVSGAPDNDKSYSYGRVRVADFVLTLQWMLEKNTDPDRTIMLWECMENLYHYSLKWEAWYNEAEYFKHDLYRLPANVTKSKMHYLHGVNIAQGLKTPSVMHRFTHNSSFLQTARDAIDWTREYHSAASGTILADERIDGLSPWSGSELCTTVELIFSLIHVHNALGRNQDADHAELVAFNALPTMLTDDHWAHQYMTQPNQPWSKTLQVSPFFDANASAQTFGLEPHYPCCTVNHPQGLPKFLAGSWAKVGRSGLAHVLLSPGTVKIDGLSVECQTQYPFAGTLEYTINAQRPFAIYLRVPGWTKAHNIVRGKQDSIKQLHSNVENNFRRIDVGAGITELTFTLDAEIRLEQRANHTVAVHHGALLYVLEIQQMKERTPPMAFNQTEYPPSYAPAESRNFVITNKSAWNIAIDPKTLKFDRKADVELPDPIWAVGAPPTYMTAQGCKIDWPLFKGVVPGAPPPLKDRKCLDATPMTVRLVPLGSTMIHMAEIPTIDLG